MNENSTPVKGYKVTKADWSCAPVFSKRKQYSVPGRFTTNTEPSLCNHGMHFCKKLSDCFTYYPFNPDLVKVAEVVAHGTVVEGEDKCSTNDLEFVREVPWEEVLRIVNEGKNCTGLRNTGDWNTGNGNTGNRNTGDGNTGDWNTGDWNTGDWNTGDWNKASHSTGCFNTEEAEIMMFNKPSGMTYSQWRNSLAFRLMSQIPRPTVVWVWEDDMTEAEKAANLSYKTTGGFLRALSAEGEAQKWWDRLDHNSRAVILALPNFDAEIFRQCTGINVEEQE